MTTKYQAERTKEGIASRQGKAETYSARPLGKFVYVDIGGLEAEGGQAVEDKSDTSKEVVVGGLQRRRHDNQFSNIKTMN